MSMGEEPRTKRHITENPIVLAAVIAAAASLSVAAAAAISAVIASGFQSGSDAARLQATILLEVAKIPNLGERAITARQLIESGLLKDDDGMICVAFVKSQQGGSCPIKPQKAN